MEDNQASIHSFIKNYMTEKLSRTTGDQDDLESLHSPLPEKVEMLSRHGGLELIKTFDAKEVYNYSMLIFDIAKLALGVNDTDDESEIEIQRRRPPAPTPQEDILDAIQEDGTEALPPVPIDLEDWRIWESRIEALLRTANDSRQFSSMAQPFMVPQSTPLPRGGDHIFPGQSTPLRSESFPMPQAIADEGSARFSTIPRHKHRQVIPLPTIRDEQLDQPGGRDGFSVGDFIRRSREQMEERNFFDAPLRDAGIPDLPPDDDLASEIRQTFLERRRERNQRRNQRQHIIPLVPSRLKTLPKITTAIAQRAQDRENYLDCDITPTLSLIQSYLAFARNEASIPENVQYTIPESIEEMRAGELQSGLGSINASQDQLPNQQSIDSNLISIIPQRRPESVELPSLRSPNRPSLQPILVPDFVERLIDVNPVIEPVELRPRNAAEGIFRGQVANTRRKRRRRNIVGNEVAELIPPEFEGQIIPLAAEPISDFPTAIRPTDEGLQLSPSVNRPIEPERDFLAAEDISQYFKKKFQVWLVSLREKAKANRSGHMNPLTDIIGMEQFCKETREVLERIGQNEYTDIKSLIPSNISKISASQRIAILLELNTRNFVELKRDETSSVIGVENLSHSTVAIDNIPSTSTQNYKRVVESGFSEAMSGLETESHIRDTRSGVSNM